MCSASTAVGALKPIAAHRSVRERGGFPEAEGQSILCSDSMAQSNATNASRTCSAPCSSSIRVTSARTCSGTRWSTRTAMPRPPASSTRVAVSSIVSGRFISDRWDWVVRPVT
jgi:hypothetical protein